MHAGAEIGVGRVGSLEDECGGLRRSEELLLEQFDEIRRSHLVRRGVPAIEDERAFLLGHQFDVSDRLRRVVGNSFDDANEPVHQTLHLLMLEEIREVLHAEVQ